MVDELSGAVPSGGELSGFIVGRPWGRAIDGPRPIAEPAANRPAGRAYNGTRPAPHSQTANWCPPTPGGYPFLV